MILVLSCLFCGFVLICFIGFVALVFVYVAC